jgi:exonuclease SbcC
MKLHSISLRNFRLHADTTIMFPPEGILGILGSNETGKSTILEGLEWIFYGGSTTRGTKEGLRWFRAPARQTAAGKLIFFIGGHGYRVERTENDATVFSYPGDKVLAKGTAAVNAYIPGIIKMDHKAFTSSFIVKQKDVDRIRLMLPTERVAFIRGIMGMGAIDEGLKACRKRKGELSQERDGLAAGLGERLPLETAVDDATANVLAAQVRVSNDQASTEGCAQVLAKANVDRGASMDDARENHRLTGLHGQAERDIQGVATERDRLEVKLARIIGAGERLALVGPVVDTLPALRLDRDAFVAAKAAQSERRTLSARVDQLEADIAHRGEIKADAERQIGFHDHDAWTAGTRAVLDAELTLKKMRDERAAKRAGFVVKADGHDADAERYAHRLGILRGTGPEGECPTCAHILGDAYRDVVDALGYTLNKARENAAICRAEAMGLKLPCDEEMEADASLAVVTTDANHLDTFRADSMRAELVVTREEAEIPKQSTLLFEAQARLGELSTTEFDAEELASVEQEIVRIGILDTELAPDRALVAQSRETRDLLAAQALLDVDAQGRLESAVSSLALMAFDLEAHEALERIATEASEAERKATVSLAGSIEAEKFSVDISDRAKAALASYDERAVRLTEVDAKHLAHEHAAYRLADFRVAIATTLRPEMEELMSGFVQILTDGRHESVELSEDFDAILYENGVPVEVVSGGTEDISALAMRLALSQMIAERAGHPLSLLWLDEPFGSQDENRRGNVLTLIRRLKGIFAQVIVISHVAETRDAVDHVVELEFDEGAGKAVVVAATYTEEAA